MPDESLTLLLSHTTSKPCTGTTIMVKMHLLQSDLGGTDDDYGVEGSRAWRDESNEELPAQSHVPKHRMSILDVVYDEMVRAAEQEYSMNSHVLMGTLEDMAWQCIELWTDLGIFTRYGEYVTRVKTVHGKWLDVRWIEPEFEDEQATDEEVMEEAANETNCGDKNVAAEAKSDGRYVAATPEQLRAGHVLRASATLEED